MSETLSKGEAASAARLIAGPQLAPLAEPPLLSGSLQAVKLAGSVSSTHGADIDLLSRQLVAQEEIRRARNVYEHLDKYLAGRGNIQKAESARHDMHLPQVGITGQAGGISRIEVRIGADPWVDVFSAIDSARGTLNRVTALLNSEA